MHRPMKAWLTCLIGVQSIVFADTRGQAKKTTLDSASSVGFVSEGISFIDVHAKRAKDYDGMNVGKMVLSNFRCYSRETVMQNSVEK